MDVLEAETLELRYGFATAEATRAIDEHWFLFVEGGHFGIKGLVADGDVHGFGQSASIEFAFRAHIEHLSFRMLAEPRIGFIGIQIGTDAARRGFEEAAIPVSFIPIPKADDGSDDEESPEHTAKDHEGFDVKGRSGSSELLHLQREAFEEVAAHVVAKFGDARISDEADDGETFLAATDHPGIGERLHMAGDIRLREAGGLDELGDVQLATFFESAENLQTARLGERAEPGGDECERLISDRW